MLGLVVRLQIAARELAASHALTHRERGAITLEMVLYTTAVVLVALVALRALGADLAAEIDRIRSEAFKK